MKKAVTFGRYSIPTLAHLSTFQTILLKWDNLSIGIIDSSMKKKNDVLVSEREFYQLCEKNYQKPSNVFSINERKEMLSLMIDEYDLSSVVTIDVITRPEYDYEGFEIQYPKKEYDLVFPEQDKHDTAFDADRNRAFGNILQRRVFSVTPCKTLHLSDIITRIKKNAPPEQFFAQSVVEYLKRIKGFERLF